MAVSSTTTSYSGLGTGALATYGTGIYANASDQIKVYADGVLKTLGGDYTLNNVGGSAGVDVVGSFTNGAAIYIERVTPITQLVDTQNNETILEDVLDAEFDKLTMIAQELAGSVLRAILVPKGETGVTLPAAASRIGKYLAFDLTGAAVLSSGTGSDPALRADLAADTGSALLTYKRTGTGTKKTTQARYNQRVAHLFDYIDNAVIPHDTILNNTATADLAPYLQAAIDDIPAAGGVLILPPCDIRVASPITIGNGTNTTLSTKNGQVIRCDSYNGTDDGTFGGGNRPASTRILYTGAAAPAAYLLTINGPIRNVDLRGIVLDCNGLCGYPMDLTWLIESYIEATGTKWTTGQGRARVRDVAMPAGVTIGFFKNVLKIRTKLPWQAGAILRGTQGFQYLGGPTNNQGFSKNVIECEHTFDNLGTYAMQCRYIDNNQFREVWTRSSTGVSPLSDATLQGTGVQIAIPQGATPLGENVFNGNFGGGNNGSGGFRSVEYVYEGAATNANKYPDLWQSFGMLDYEMIPLSRLAKIAATDGTLNNGITGSMAPLMGRSAANLSTTTTEFLCPVGMAATGANRFVTDLVAGRTGYIHTFEVYLGIAPGGAATRTFTVHVNGVDVATVFFDSGESGLKRAAVFAPVGLLSNAQISIKSTLTGAPAASGVSWTVGVCPTEAIAY